MAKLFFICGRIGTGKTTLAGKLKKEHDAIVFSADEWMLHFFDEDMPRPEFDRRLNQCKEMIYRLCGEVLTEASTWYWTSGFGLGRRGIC